MPAADEPSGISEPHPAPVAEVIQTAAEASTGGALDFFFEDGGERKKVRVVMIDGAPWFVGKDVAERLGYADPTNAMKQHCKGVVKRHPLSTPGGTQNIRVLSEPDVLRLIVGSNLPAAQRPRRSWSDLW